MNKKLDSSTANSSPRIKVSRRISDERLLKVLNNTKADETIVAIDTEAGAGKIIGVGIVIFHTKNLLPNSRLQDELTTRQYGLLHPSRLNELFNDPFWRDKQKLAQELVNEEFNTELEMYDTVSVQIESFLENIIRTNTNVKFLIGTAQDIFYLARININLQMLAGFCKGRVILLDMLYRGGISTFDLTKVESDNPYNIIRKKYPNVNQSFKQLRERMGETTLHDCIDDCKANLVLYLAYVIGMSRFYDKLRIMLNF
jgi:hypothetical protein